MRTSIIISRIFLVILLILATSEGKSQNDTIPPLDDTINIDSKVDSTVDKEGPIEHIIHYPAADSTVYDITQQRVRMYNDAKVTYDNITLEADYIEYDFKNGSVYAYGMTDTAGVVQGRPKFTESGQAFTCDTIKYRFDTKKGLIKTVRTDDGESYVHAEVSKKHENDHIHNAGGMYTTCSAEKPHYHFRFNKMVIIPDDKIVTGPAYMKVGSVPLPLGIPFGFFPNTTKRKKGIVMPNYGFSNGLGYYLIDGGYYLPLGPHWDNKLTADIYSLGSWGLRNVSRYKKNYKYSGQMDLQYNRQLRGDPELIGFNRTNSFFVRWNHSMDGKARPGTTFTGSINAGSSNNFTNNYNSSQNDYVSNTFTSNVSYSKRFPTSNIAISARHSQNTQNGAFSITLPQLTYNKSRFFLPLSFLTKDELKAKKLDNKIGINYSSNFRNLLNTNESDLRLDNIGNLINKEVVNGVQHTANMNTSIKLGYFTLNPRVAFNHRWHFKKEQQSFDFNTLEANTEEVRGFFATSDWSAGTDLTTKLYGTVTTKGKIQAIRHVITPSLGYSYRPELDFNESYEDTVSTINYNPFVVSAYTQNSSGLQSNLNFRLQNNLEMKVKTDKDSVATTKKIKLIENFTVNSSYNMAAEEFNLADITMNARTTLFENVALQWTGRYDPYQVDSTGTRINQFRWNGKGPFLRMENSVFSLSTSFRGGTGENRNKEVPTEFADTADLEEIDNDPGRFVNFNIPWSLNLSYNFNIRKDYNYDLENDLLRDTTIVAQHGVMFNGEFTVLENWKVSFTSGYDLVNEEFTPTNLTLYWDLHCWELRGNVIPFGLRKSYTIGIGVKAAVLQDLKYQQRGTLDRNNQLFY